MKKILIFLLIAVVLTVSVSAKTVVLLDGSKMTTGAQSTQMETMKYSVNDGKINIYLKDGNTDNWGWLIFDEYKHSENWADYEGVVMRVSSGKNPIQFGLSGMANSKQTARIEFQKSGIIAYDVKGNDVSADFTSYKSMSNSLETEWGAGDPCFTIPANFDGYIFFPYSGAYCDRDCDIKNINTMACFLFGDTQGEANSINIEYCSLYTGDTKSVLFEIDPSLAAAKVAAADTSAVTAAPQTADIAGVAVIAFISACVCAVAINKKSIKRCLSGSNFSDEAYYTARRRMSLCYYLINYVTCMLNRRALKLAKMNNL